MESVSHREEPQGGSHSPCQDPESQGKREQGRNTIILPLSTRWSPEPVPIRNGPGTRVHMSLGDRVCKGQSAGQVKLIESLEHKGHQPKVGPLQAVLLGPWRIYRLYIPD